jgi:hypothetical protein
MEAAALLGLDPDVADQDRADARADEYERDEAPEREADDEPRRPLGPGHVSTDIGRPAPPLNLETPGV